MISAGTTPSVLARLRLPLDWLSKWCPHRQPRLFIPRVLFGLWIIDGDPNSWVLGAEFMSNWAIMQESCLPQYASLSLQWSAALLLSAGYWMAPSLNNLRWSHRCRSIPDQVLSLPPFSTGNWVSFCSRVASIPCGSVNRTLLALISIIQAVYFEFSLVGNVNSCVPSSLVLLLILNRLNPALRSKLYFLDSVLPIYNWPMCLSRLVCAFNFLFQLLL